MQPKSLRHARIGSLFLGTLAAAGVLAGAGSVHAQSARAYINIVGSSTVYPFATVVAERLGRASGYATPKIESTGSGGGIKLFCAGVGVRHPDIVNASRPITASELESCARNGVTDVIEFKIGYDGIVLATSDRAEPFELDLRQIYLALASNVPDPSAAERLVPNPYKTWADIDPRLPGVRIEVLGPPPTSGTRDAFLELAMEGGCDSFEWIADLGADERRRACHTIREDGAFIEAGENDNLIVQKLGANPTAVGIFGYSFLEQNTDRVRGLPVDGVEPEFDTIADGTYPISRPLYFYVKKAHVGVVPGIEEYVSEFMSEDAAGEFGYLSELGLVPLTEDEREEMAERIDSLSVPKLSNAR